MKFAFRPILLTIFIFLFSQLGVRAQGSKSDYARSAKLRDLTEGKAWIPKIDPQWKEGGSEFWYSRNPPGKEREFILVDVATGKKTLIEKPPASLAAFLSSVKSSRGGGAAITVEFTNQTAKPLDLLWIGMAGKLKNYGTLAPGEPRKQPTYAKHVWMIREAGRGRHAIFEGNGDQDVMITEADLKMPAAPPKKTDPAQSPDGKWRVQMKDHNLFVSRFEEGKWSPEKALTEDGTELDGFGGRAWWSPDSGKFVVMKTKRAEEHIVHIVESSPKDQIQPRLQSFPYLKPGDDIEVSMPHLFDVSGPEIREVAIKNDLFTTPWSLTDLQWIPDSKSFTFLYNQRGHQVMRVVAVDAASGEGRAVIEETSATFIDYAGKKFSRYLPTSNEWIWMSERDGWSHLYLYSGPTGKVKHQITSGKWVVRGVDLIDEEKRQVWFRAGGIYPDQDPYYLHYCRIDFDGGNLVVLTEGDGTHSIQFSPDRNYIIDTYSRIDQPPVTELRRASDGQKICDLEKGDWSKLLETGWQAPERFVAKGRDGTTDIYGVIFRPTNFDPGKTYPVIEQIYAGPHGSFVPKEFASFHYPQTMAELGFIVVQIDGMGTSYRSKAFHDVASKNLKDSGFPDRILWLRAAAEKYPEIDLTRVGIYGGSAGGQSALAALLWHGDFYKAAVADCGCHDNRMDKIWWNELWMGWPVDKSYEENSNVVNARLLTGKLLLTVGELDHNVDPASTMQVVNALIQADKDFDMIVVPGAGHGVGETEYMKRRRADFFVKHLLGVEPRW